MRFLNRHKTSVALAAGLVLVFAIFTVVQAGPGCSAAKKAACTKSTSTTAKASCSGSKTAQATLASGTVKGCSKADKETCINKCMAEKGMTRAEAEACWAKCQAKMTQASATHTGTKSCSKSCSKTCTKTCAGHSNVQTAAVVDGKHLHSRQACIDACIARGMSRADAEAAADKCEKAGYHTTASAHTTAAAASSGTK